MIPCLNSATTGGSESPEEFIAVAGRHGFGGIDCDIRAVRDVMEQKSVEAVRDLLGEAGVKLASFSLPVEFRKDEARFKEDLQELPRLRAVAANLGCTRCCTWLAPSTDEAVAEFTCRVVRRLRECANVLGKEAIRLAIEWVGPVTARTLKHDFI